MKKTKNICAAWQRCLRMLIELVLMLIRQRVYAG